MKLKIALALLFGTGYLLITGGIRVVEGIRLRSPQTITYQRLAAEHSGSGWYRITGGLICLTEAVAVDTERYPYNTTTLREVYVPIRDARLLTGESTDNGDTTQVVLQTSDPGILSKIESLKGLSAEAVARKPASDLFPAGDITAMVASGTHGIEHDEDMALRNVMRGITPTCVILTNSEHPSVLGGFGMFLGGLALGVVCVCFLAKYGNT